MRKQLLRILQVLCTLTLTGLFSVLVFGQDGPLTPAESPNEAMLRIIGQLAIVGAGVTYVTLNIYNAVRGKNYEQLKEAVCNYKELAESRKAQIAERDAIVARLRAENIALEISNDRLQEKFLRS